LNQFDRRRTQSNATYVDLPQVAQTRTQNMLGTILLPT